MIYIKSFLKRFPVILTAALLLISCIWLPSFGVSAASPLVSFVPSHSFESPDYYDIALEVQSAGDYVGKLFLWTPPYTDSVSTLPAGDYIVYGNPYVSHDLSVPPLQVAVISLDDEDHSASYYSFGEVFSVPSDGSYSILCQSFSAPTISEVHESAPLYQSAWDALVKYIYGEGELTPEQNLVMTFLSTFLCLFCIALPFLACFAVCKWCRL